MTQERDPRARRRRKEERHPRATLWEMLGGLTRREVRQLIRALAVREAAELAGIKAQIRATFAPAEEEP